MFGLLLPPLFFALHFELNENENQVCGSPQFGACEMFAQLFGIVLIFLNGHSVMCGIVDKRLLNAFQYFGHHNNLTALHGHPKQRA